MDMISQLILIGIIIIVLALTVLLLAKQYRKVGPNEVLIISGGRKRTVIAPDGTKTKIGYRYRLGGGAFVLPFLETVNILPIEAIALNIKTPEVLTNSGVPIMAEAVAQVKIDSSDYAIRLAAEQFLGLGKEGIKAVAETVLEGRMRDVMGTMTVEEIYKGRHEFSANVTQAAHSDFSRMGLNMMSFSLKDISDTQGYLDALGKPQISAAKRDATIAEAETDKEAIIKSSEARKEGEIARLAAEALIAKAQWENEAKKAESQVDVNEKKAKADFAYEIERTKLAQEMKKEEYKVKLIEKQEAIKLEEFEIARKEKELDSNVLKPADARKYQMKAEAEAEEYRIQAEARGKADALKLEGLAEAEIAKQLGFAEAEAMLKKAQAWDKYNQAAILEMYLKILPELAKAVSEPLSKVDKIVVIGGDKNLGTTKITSQVAEILAQMPEVVKSLTGVDFKDYLKKKLASKEEVKDEE
ncbi:MAG: SPFH domain-containing protein [Candidatus Aminicenantes bacterium]|nr:SPFH domain-containing protein [Candidatus Aminicenantes bacterium]MDH5383151.1 SPFH domain-containing protein [Candidatus Aminicenantes bacterium]MDH5742187.1 SPFH domain-containing protein [Candidatus Aminicenantes bacterium]